MQKVNSYDRKYFLLSEKIKQIFRDGFVLSSNIVHYINSTFSNPSITELEEIINDENNCEKDSLVELLCFPDESIQIKLEELLEKENFKEKNEEKLLSYILNEKLLATIHFPDSENSLIFHLPKLSAIQFISHLNISKKINKRLLNAIDQFVSDKLRTIVKVKLRNDRLEFSENKIIFLCHFFKKLKVKEDSFFNCLDFILKFFEILKDDSDILRSLTDRKEFYFQNIQKVARFEELLNKNNMETLISSGVRIPHISKEDAMNNIVIIDTITLAIYSKAYPSTIMS